MDRQTLAALVRAHQAALYRYVRYLGAERTAAEDLVQETFLVAFRSSGAAPRQEGAGMAGWLRGVARNLFLRHCRRARSNPVRVDSALLERAEATWAEHFLRSGDGFDTLEALRQCLETVSDEQRRVLDLRYAQGKSRAEMAALCQMTENGVKSLLRRIRARLAECIERRLAMEQG